MGTPIPAVVLAVIYILEQINTNSGTHSVTVNLVNAFFSVPISRKEQILFAFTWQGH